MQKDILITNSLGGLYNGNFAKFIASSQFDMVEKSEQKISGVEGWDVKITIDKPENKTS